MPMGTEEIRRRAADDLRTDHVVMDGHFDDGNGFHGTVSPGMPVTRF